VTGMAPERITVTITSSIGEDAPLTVNDAMRQILDFFGLLSAAGGDEASLIAWQLVDISMHSPLRATAEAVPTTPGVIVEPIARREKFALAVSIEALVTKSAIPSWMDRPARDRAKALFARNTNGIGRTDILLEEGVPVLTI